MLTQELEHFYRQNGYVVVPQLFSAEEAARYRDHFMQLRAAGPYEFDMVADTQKKNDPLQKFPRMAHMHRWDELSLHWVLDTRLHQCLTALLGKEPAVAQTMLYFKPPGARGQALHQDNYYLQAQPSPCIAAWMALDACDEDNGCMQVVPGSHQWPLLCAEKANSDTSFTDVTVPVPPGTEVAPVLMQPGDVMFFHGCLVHGSTPNKTTDCFRRSLIAHYVEASTTQLTHYDLPALSMDGSLLEIEASEGGGICGHWTTIDSEPTIVFGEPEAPAPAKTGMH